MVSKMSNGVPLCYWLFSCVLATPGLSNLVSSSCLPCFSAILKSRCAFLWKCYIQYLQPTTSSKKKAEYSVLFGKHIEFLTQKEIKETHIRSHPITSDCVWPLASSSCAMSEVMADFWQANELADAAAKSWYALPMVHQLEAAAPGSGFDQGVKQSTTKGSNHQRWGYSYLLNSPIDPYCNCMVPSMCTYCTSWTTLNHGFLWGMFYMNEGKD